MNTAVLAFPAPTRTSSVAPAIELGTSPRPKMAQQKRRGSFDRPTTARDWIGAKVNLPGEKHPQKTNGAKFQIYRAQGMRLTFAVTDGKKPPARAGLGRSVDWEFMKTVDEAGGRRVGFAEADAKKAIAERGYLLIKLPA